MQTDNDVEDVTEPDGPGGTEPDVSLAAPESAGSDGRPPHTMAPEERSPEPSVAAPDVATEAMVEDPAEPA